MLKWFYKYNKILLVVLGSFLMVVFLLPGSNMFRPTPSSVTVGTVDGETITQGDLHQAATEIDMLARQFPPLPESHPAHFPTDPLHWLLLLREAERNGVYVSKSEARLLVDNMDPKEKANVLSGYRISEDGLIRTYQHALMWQRLLDMVVDSDRPSEPRLRHYAQTTRSRLGIELVAVDATEMLKQVDKPTDAQLLEHFNKYKSFKPGESKPYGFGYYLPDRVKIEYITVSRDDVAASITVDEVDAQRYYLDHPEMYMPPPPAEKPADGATPADKPADKPADGAAPSGDTPATPDATKPAPDAGGADAPKKDGDAKPADGSSDASDVIPSLVSATEVTQNDAPAAATDTAKPATTAAPATKPDDAATAAPTAPDAPDAPKKAPGPQPYREVREKVIKDVRDAEAAKKQDRIVKTIRALLDESRRGLPTDPAGYLVLNKHTPVPFEKIAEQIQAEFGVLPKVTRVDNRWMNVRDVATETHFGKSSLQFAGQRYPVARYAFAVKELHDGKENPDAALRQVRLQLNVASIPVTDDLDSVHIFRVFDISPAHEPKKIDEVALQVEGDWRRLQAYKQLESRTEALVSRARTEGLQEVAKGFDTVVYRPEPFAKRDEKAIQQALQRRQLAMMLGMPELAANVEITDVPNVEGVGRSEDFLDAVFKLAAKLREAGGIIKADPKLSVDAIRLDRQMRIVLVDIVDDMPIDSGQYATEKLAVSNDMRMQEMREQSKQEMDIANNPLSKDALIKRLHYVDANPTPDKPKKTDGDNAGTANAQTKDK